MHSMAHAPYANELVRLAHLTSRISAAEVMRLPSNGYIRGCKQLT